MAAIAAMPLSPAFGQQNSSDANAAAQQSINNISGGAPTATFQDVTQGGNNQQINQQIINDQGSSPRISNITCPKPNLVVTTGSQITPFNGQINNSNFIGLALSVPLGSTTTCRQAQEAAAQKLIVDVRTAEENLIQKRLQTTQYVAAQNLALTEKKLAVLQICAATAKAIGVTLQAIPECSALLGEDVRLPQSDQPRIPFTPSGRGLDSAFSEDTQGLGINSQAEALNSKNAPSSTPTTTTPTTTTPTTTTPPTGTPPTGTPPTEGQPPSAEDITGEGGGGRIDLIID